MTRCFSLVVATLAAGLLLTGGARPALAQGPTAIVEEIGFESGDLLEFDYLFAGREITVPPGGRLVIGYLSSCLRETVTGGAIRIGAAQSEGDAQIAREEMSCAGAASVAGADASATALTAILRGGGDAADTPGDRPVNSTLPVFLVPHNADTLTIARLDADAPEVEVAASGGVVDLATAGAGPLSPGGVYFASAGAAFIEFSVAAGAEAVNGPATPRLVRLR